jgi:cytoskeletal protein RodZ
MPAGPTDERSTDQRPPAPDPRLERARRQTFANMLRSLLPLVLIVVGIVAWQAFKQGPDVVPVKPIDPSSTIALAANRAGYPLQVPTGLPGGYRPTSARTDAGDAAQGDPVTLEIGYVTPTDQFAAFVVSDDPEADPLTAVLTDAEQQGDVQIDGETWTRWTREQNRATETVLTRAVDGATVLVTGSAAEQELETVAAAVAPYSG